MPRNPDIPGAFPVWRTFAFVAACAVVLGLHRAVVLVWRPIGSRLA